jgi:hypothetical protein
MDPAEQERRRRAIAESRELLADLDAFDDVMAVRELVSVEDPVSRWRREAEEELAMREAAQPLSTAQLNAQNTREWERWADTRIAAALAKHDRVRNDVVGQALAIIRRELREELQNTVAELREELLAEISKAYDGGSVIRRIRINNDA